MNYQLFSPLFLADYLLSHLKHKANTSPQLTFQACFLRFNVLFLRKFMTMDNLPQDPFILFSYINTKLRDNYTSLDILCEELDVDKNVLINKLSTIGMTYDATLNKFI